MPCKEIVIRSISVFPIGDINGSADNAADID